MDGWDFDDGLFGTEEYGDQKDLSNAWAIKFDLNCCNIIKVESVNKNENEDPMFSQEFNKEALVGKLDEQEFFGFDDDYPEQLGGFNVYFYALEEDPFVITDMIRATITVNEPN